MFQDNFFIVSYSALLWHIIHSVFKYPSYHPCRRPQQHGVFLLAVWGSQSGSPIGALSDFSLEPPVQSKVQYPQEHKIFSVRNTGGECAFCNIITKRL